MTSSSPSRADSERDDLALYEAIGRAGNVVLATTEVDASGHTNVLGGDANLRQIHALAAASNLPADTGGVIRRYPYSLLGLKSFAVAAAQTAGHGIGPRALPARRGADRFPRTPGHDQDRFVLRRPERARRPADVRRQGRRRRALGADAAGRPSDIDRVRHPDGGSGDPGQRDLDRASRQPASACAIVARADRDPPLRDHRAARFAALSRSRLGTHRRGPRQSPTSCSPRSRSNQERSSCVSYRSRRGRSGRSAWCRRTTLPRSSSATPSRASCTKASSSSYSVSLRPSSHATPRRASTSTASACCASVWPLQIGWSPSEAETLRHASVMHDIGKIGIPDRVLLKPGQARRRGVGDHQDAHHRRAPQILAGSHNPLVQMAEDIARCPPRALGRQRLPRGLEGRGDPARGAHLRGGRRLRRAALQADLQGGLADGGRPRGDSSEGAARTSIPSLSPPFSSSRRSSQMSSRRSLAREASRALVQPATA